MKNLALKIGSSVLGLIVVLGYWTFFDRKPAAKGTSHMPGMVLGGGGDKLTVDVDVNGKVQVGMMVEEPRRADGSQPIEEYYENLDPGHHSFVIELAPETTGVVDLRALEPKIGNKLSWTVTRNGKQIAQESDTLDKPLQAGYSQSLQFPIEQATDDENE